MLYDPHWKPVEIKLEPWQKILLRAAEILEEKGWCQNRGTDDRGRHCAGGAVFVAIAEANITDLMTYGKVTQKFFEKSQLHYNCFPHWNDYPGRTKDEVITALREAAK